MTRVHDYPGAPAGSAPPPGGGSREGLDLFDVLALAWAQKGFIALIFAVLFAAGVAAALLLVKPSYEAESRLLVLLENDPTPSAAGAGGAFMLDQIMQSESELLGSDAVQRLAVQTIGAAAVLGEPVVGDADRAARKALQSGLSISREPNSSALIARYEAADPDRAALVLNAVVDAYLAYRQQVLVEAGVSTLSERRSQADIAVRNAQSALDVFLTSNQLANFDSDKLAAESSVSAIQDRLRLAAAERDSANAGANALQARLANIPESIQLYVENGATNLLLERRVDREQLLSRYQPGAPPVVALDREIEAIEGLLAAGGAVGLGQQRTGVNPVRQAMETDLATRRANAQAEANRVAVLERQLVAAQAEVSRLRDLEPAFTRLSQNVTAAEATAGLLAGQEAIAAARRSLGPGAADAVRVFDRAAPPLQGSSLKKLALIAVLVLSGGIALMAGLLRGYWDAYLRARRPVYAQPASYAPVSMATPTAAPYVAPAAAAAYVPHPPPVSYGDLPILARVAERRA
jgi:uncharacterized protein involved in exopolysaccharide biosynthesis